MAVNEANKYTGRQGMGSYFSSGNVCVDVAYRQAKYKLEDHSQI
jgi:hypothetical protein